MPSIQSLSYLKNFSSVLKRVATILKAVGILPHTEVFLARSGTADRISLLVRLLEQSVSERWLIVAEVQIRELHAEMRKSKDCCTLL